MNIKKLTALIKKAQGDRSQNEYAAHIGVSPASISRLLRGERVPSSKMLKKLASKAYNGVTYGQLMEASGYLDIYLTRDRSMTLEEAISLYHLDNESDAKDISIVKNIQKLCREHGISIPKIEREFGFGNGSLYNWDKNSPSIDRLQKVAEYFNVSIDYIVYGSDIEVMGSIPNEKHEKRNFTTLLPLGQEQRIIAEDLELMIDTLDKTYGTSDTPEDEEDRELLKASLITSMKLAKQIARKKSPK